MKIGILTFHSARNYGAVLQCYALQRYLSSIGNDVYIIDYRNESIMRNYALFDFRRMLSKHPVKLLQRISNEIILYNSRKNRKKGFDEFIKNEMKISNFSIDFGYEYDLIIVGSDQIWNFELTKGYDQYYWGNFKRAPNTLLASYAASMMDSWNNSATEKIKPLLENFDFLSVRETSTFQKLSHLTEKKIELVVDPTLLLSTEQWQELDKDKKSVDKPYLLLYQVEVDKRHKKIADAIAKDLDLEIKYLCARENGLNSKDIISASPYRFISLFKNAKFIVSSSFHGTVFSLIFNKPFLSIRSGKNKDSRVQTLLEYFNLNNRFVSNYDSNLLPIYTNDYDINISRTSVNSKIYIDNIIRNGEQ